MPQASCGILADAKHHAPDRDRPSGAEVTVMVAVQTGLVADGWIEITSGLTAGEAVRLPG